MSGKKESEFENYWEAQRSAGRTGFREDGRTRMRVQTSTGEYIHMYGYLQAPVAPGLYPAETTYAGSSVSSAGATYGGSSTRSSATTYCGSSVSSAGATYGGSSTRSAATTYGGSSVSSAGATYGGTSTRSAADTYALSATKAAATKSWVEAAGSGPQPAASGGNRK